MSIFIPGMTCKLCGEAMVSQDDVVALAHFVERRSDPLWLFTDGIFHKKCFHNHPLAEKAMNRYHECANHAKPSNRLCHLCGKLIDNPDDYLNMGRLTENRADSLYEYNDSHFHRSCLSSWAQLSLFVGDLERLCGTKSQKDEYIDSLLKIVKPLL